MTNVIIIVIWRRENIPAGHTLYVESIALVTFPNVVDVGQELWL